MKERYKNKGVSALPQGERGNLLYFNKIQTNLYI